MHARPTDTKKAFEISHKYVQTIQEDKKKIEENFAVLFYAADVRIYTFLVKKK